MSEKSYEEEVSERLTLAREWKGLTKSEWARAVDIKESHWTTFEKGCLRIPLDQARKLKATFGIQLDWIYDGDISDKMPAGLLAYITKKNKL